MSVADPIGRRAIGRVVRSSDFERVLAQRSRLQSAHFALHYLDALPSMPMKPQNSARVLKLSTGVEPDRIQAVDDSLSAAPTVAVASVPVRYDCEGLWLGTVVPKRHARRAVTRTLLKRQIRSAVTAQAAYLKGGLWVVRLRAGFERKVYPSAASVALLQAVRTELDGLLARCRQASLPSS